MRLCGRWVRSSSSVSFVCALGIAGFVWFIRVRTRGRWFVWFVLVHPEGRWVRSGSYGASGCAVGVVEFVWVRLIRLGAQWASLSSYGFAWFVRVRPGSRWVPSGLRFGGRWVRFGWSGSSGCSVAVLDSFGFASFVQVRPRGRWVLSGSSGCTLGVAGFINISVRHVGR